MKEHMSAQSSKRNSKRASQLFDDAAVTSPTTRFRRATIASLFSETRLKQKVVNAFKSNAGKSHADMNNKEKVDAEKIEA